MESQSLFLLTNTPYEYAGARSLLSSTLAELRNQTLSTSSGMLSWGLRMQKVMFDLTFPTDATDTVKSHYENATKSDYL
eukprot:scaffold148464_cov18-Tisochrysis_lutea.AAC.1